MESRMTKEVEPELVARMANAIRRHVSGYTGPHQGLSMEAEFRAIAGLLPEPASMEVLEARAIALEFSLPALIAGLSSAQTNFGNFDDHNVMNALVAAIKRGRELAQVSA